MERPSHAGLRHVALNARRLEEMKRFYVDLLGFAIEWEPDADNIYLSSGVDNLALHRSPGAVAPRSTETALDHATSAPRTATASKSFIIRQSAAASNLGARRRRVLGI